VTIDVPAPQRALAEAVAATGKPVVVLLRNGRALELTGAVKDAQAIVVGWFLGSEMGNSVADVLFGDHSPSGRLPVSFPHFSGQQPYTYDHKSTGRPADPDRETQEYVARYREATNTALYPFGHGLTYGEIAYSDLSLGSETLPWNGGITISARIANRGRQAAEETVQLYIRDRVASLTRPVRELKDIRKVALRPGETKTVTFTLRREQLEFVGADLTPTVEPGAFDVFVAPSAQTGLAGSFRLVR